MNKNFVQNWWKRVWESWVKGCGKVSTSLTLVASDVLISWKSWGSGKVVHEFYRVIYTGFWDGFSLLGGEFYTFST